MEVTAWIEQVTIPTYKVGQPEKNPMFLEKRVYQGSSGVVYPHPVIEHIADEKEDVEYTAVFIENEYLKIMILPEIGGRIQRAYDKIRKRDFVYYNQVIKPALVGLAGPWISGGIEFNWPQHHRPSTFQPVDYTIEENADGSKTVWVNEIEVMFRTKGMAGFTLYPDKAYLEIKGKLFNRTPFPQTFLWWANPAVKVNEHYQSVFPPDVYAVFDHGKRDVSDFPIATGTYYKVNYAPGTDISRYDTIPVPTSYMAIRSKYNFMGCYEHDTGGGMLHVADHHVSPGKKQWTWGNGDFGYAWDRNLTDEDGPYIELMTGVFTDNQPDFSWLQPNEGKSFEQYFMPYAQIGVVKNATKEAMLNMEFKDGQLLIKVYATAVYKDAVVQVLQQHKIVKEFRIDLAPADIFETAFSVEKTKIFQNNKGDNKYISETTFGEEKAQGLQNKDGKEYNLDTEFSIGEVQGLQHKEGNDDHFEEADIQVIVRDAKGKELVSWQPEKAEKKEIPVAATAAKLPAEIEQVEDLYLNGLHLEQYRHATFNPMDYYAEGLRRSPGDVRCNNAMGLLYLRRGQFEKSIPYFRTAIKTQTSRNPNPYDGEVYYNLGLALQYTGALDEAYDSFYKATWNDAWQHSGFLMLARIAAVKGEFANALSLVDKSLIRNYHSHTARHLKAVLLKLNGQDNTAFIKESLSIDPFNYGCLFEMKALMRVTVNNYLELSLDYAHAGMYRTAMKVLDQCTESTPLVYYYKGWFAGKSGDAEQALALYQQAATLSPDKCFPNKIEEILILESAIALNPADAKAYYYLGNLWYDKRQYPEAIANWEAAARLDITFPTPYRNLSLAYYNKLRDKQRAVVAMEKAFALDRNDSRVLMELDQLYKITGRGFEERLALLDDKLVAQRDDLYLERVTLYNNLGRFEEARAALAARKFHPWEGGEGKVVGQYILCHTELAKQAIEQKDFLRAIDLLNAVSKYPDNLGEGKLYGAQENDFHYLMACAHEGLHEYKKAQVLLIAATQGISEPVQAIYYNDPQPDKIVYQALAWQKLGEPEKAREIFRRFIRFGEAHMHDKVFIDYFAVSLPDMLVFDLDINLRNTIHCKYLVGLGYLGLGDVTQGRKFLDEVIQADVNHQGAVFNPLIK